MVVFADPYQGWVVPAKRLGFDVWTAHVMRLDAKGVWSIVASAQTWSQAYATRWAEKAVAATVALGGEGAC
jgi:hypothetical protein